MSKIAKSQRNERTPRGSKKITVNNLAKYLTKYEAGKLNYKETLKLFSFLIRTKLAWKLHGVYPVFAGDLINKNLITKSGKINWKECKKLKDIREAI